MPTIFERSKLGPFTKEEDLEREKILKTAGSLMSTLAIPAATILPFQDYLNDTNKIKEQELFVEVIIAPDFSKKALEILSEIP